MEITFSHIVPVLSIYLALYPVIQFIPTSALFFPRIGQNCHSPPSVKAQDLREALQ